MYKWDKQIVIIEKSLLCVLVFVSAAAKNCMRSDRIT